MSSPENTGGFRRFAGAADRGLRGLSILLVAFIAGCSSPTSNAPATSAAAPARPQPVARDISWVASAVDKPLGDLGRECVDSALRTSSGLIAFRRGKLTDDQIRTNLTGNISDAGVRAMRQADYAAWAGSHDPAAVATDHLVKCLALGNVALVTTPALQACFHAEEPAALLSILHSIKVPKPQAIAEVRSLYGNVKSTAGTLDELAAKIYYIGDFERDLPFRAIIFRQCLVPIA